MQDHAAQPKIGVFDSGIGGLAVLAAIAKSLPQTNLIYFADTAHIPYGNKEESFIQTRVLQIGQYLLAQGCTQLVVACNTATAAAVDALRKLCPDIAVVGIEPGVKPAAKSSQTKNIAVLVTESTARSKKFAGLIERHAQGVKVHIRACPGWATRVESLHLVDSDFIIEAEELLEDLLRNEVDRIVLGCTHYSFLIPTLRAIIKDRAEIVDVADAVARQVHRLAGNTLPRNMNNILLQPSPILQLICSAAPQHLEAALSLMDLAHLSKNVHIERLQE